MAEQTAVEQTATEQTMEVVWEGGMRYRAARPDGTALLLDGERQAAPSPVEAVVGALAACAAIDVAEILAKRRTPAGALRVRADYTRAEHPPRRLRRVRLRFQVTTDSERGHVERAVALSFEKYCSVAASLAPDTVLDWEVEVSGPGGSGA